jgi:hypothetical protein
VTHTGHRGEYLLVLFHDDPGYLGDRGRSALDLFAVVVEVEGFPPGHDLPDFSVDVLSFA